MTGKPGQFPQRNRGNGDAARSGSPADGPAGLFGQFCRFSRKPYQYICIEQNHRFVTSHSTGIGDSISPTILTLPDMNPKMSLFSASAGTTLTTGAPRLVTTTGSPVACTCFMTVRQCALNAPAGICFMGFSFYPWSYYHDQRGDYRQTDLKGEITGEKFTVNRDTQLYSGIDASKLAAQSNYTER